MLPSYTLSMMTDGRSSLCLSSIFCLFLLISMSASSLIEVAGDGGFGFGLGTVSRTVRVWLLVESDSESVFCIGSPVRECLDLRLLLFLTCCQFSLSVSGAEWLTLLFIVALAAISKLGDSGLGDGGVETALSGSGDPFLGEEGGENALELAGLEPMEAITLSISFSLSFSSSVATSSTVFWDAS